MVRPREVDCMLLDFNFAMVVDCAIPGGEEVDGFTNAVVGADGWTLTVLVGA